MRGGRLEDRVGSCISGPFLGSASARYLALLQGLADAWTSLNSDSPHSSASPVLSPTAGAAQVTAAMAPSRDSSQGSTGTRQAQLPLSASCGTWAALCFAPLTLWPTQDLRTPQAEV